MAVRQFFPGLALTLALQGCSAAPLPGWEPPEVRIVTCESWDTLVERDIIYVNNTWNAQAAGDDGWKQCIVRAKDDPARIGFSWDWPDRGRAIFAQPQAKIGLSPWSPQPRIHEAFPIALDSLAGMRVRTEVRVDGPSEFNLVTTLWLTDTARLGMAPQPDSIVAEVMVWTYATQGHMSPAGRKVGRVTVDGTVWDVWVDEHWRDMSGANDNRWKYIAFVSHNPGLRADFDPVALLRSDPVAGLGLDRAFMADVEHGAEIMRGEGMLWIDRFDVESRRKSE